MQTMLMHTIINRFGYNNGQNIVIVRDSKDIHLKQLMTKNNKIIYVSKTREYYDQNGNPINDVQFSQPHQ